MKTLHSVAAAAAALLAGSAQAADSSSSMAMSSAAASCSSTLTASHPEPSVADGYVARLVATDLKAPRGIIFDNDDNLLVVESGVGISGFKVTDNGGGCLMLDDKKTVVDDEDLNHGIEMSEDGKTLYASTPDKAMSWDYEDRKTTSDSKLLVKNMAGADHSTRTLLLPKHAPGMLVVCRGSTSNVDAQALDIESGHSQIKAFNISEGNDAVDFIEGGVLMGWGLRNEVGIDEEPTTGGIYGVENSVDEMTRNGDDIHTNNPGEELNFLGYLNGTKSDNQGRNFGYPTCFAAWDVDDIPDFDGKVGEQFAIGDLNSTVNDTTCSEANRQAPRLTFQAHMAPLDIVFNEDGTAAWVSFHGSWNRENPIGYKVSVIEFENGEPVADSDSKTAARDIMSNSDDSKCPDNCFRPVGLAFDSKGRLFMSSDDTGEIYAILRDDGTPTSTTGSNATGTVPTPAATSSGVGDIASMSALAVAFGLLAFVL